MVLLPPLSHIERVALQLRINVSVFPCFHPLPYQTCIIYVLTYLWYFQGLRILFISTDLHIAMLAARFRLYRNWYKIMYKLKPICACHVQGWKVHLFYFYWVLLMNGFTFWVNKHSAQVRFTKITRNFKMVPAEREIIFICMWFWNCYCVYGADIYNIYNKLICILFYWFIFMKYIFKHALNSHLYLMFSTPLRNNLRKKLFICHLCYYI